MSRRPATPDFSATHFDAYGDASLPLPSGDFWVFGYGSLMWDPGFTAECGVAARLYGYHRRLCLWSIHYRGTARRPGLVLGLDRGGCCNGVAFRVAGRNIAGAAAYLMKREMINNAYRPALKKIRLRHGCQVEALTFISKPAHPQFAPPLGIDETVAVVRTAAGKRGKNRDYVLNTAQHLSACHIHRTELHAIAEKLRGPA